MANRFSTGGNPFLQNGFQIPKPIHRFTMTTEGTMTVQGAINKSFILFGLLTAHGRLGLSSPPDIKFFHCLVAVILRPDPGLDQRF
jgi:hypothetical protein